jgi:hypothetical protein
MFGRPTSWAVEAAAIVAAQQIAAPHFEIVMLAVEFVHRHCSVCVCPPGFCLRRRENSVSNASR